MDQDAYISDHEREFKTGVDAGKGMAAQDPYWAETELEVTTSKFPRPDLKRSESKQRISWAFGLSWGLVAAPTESRGAFPEIFNTLVAAVAPGKEIKYEDSEHDLLVALKTSPIPNFCKDTGDFYASSWRPFAAWQVWDLGRLMAGHHSGDLLDGLDVIEADLVRREPTLF